MGRTSTILLALTLTASVADARVLLVDASEHAGAATPWLTELGSQLQVELGIGVVGPLLPADPAPIETAPSRHEDVEDLLERVTRQLEEFSLDAAAGTLRRAEQRLAELPDRDIGPLRIRAEELGAALAIARGDENGWPTYVQAIARRAPWWRVPPGLLTPEGAALLEATATAVQRDGAELQLAHLPEGTRVRVDGFDLDPGTDAVWVVPGDHRLQVARWGFLPRILQPALAAGQVWAVPIPGRLDLREPARNRLRACVSAEPAEDIVSTLVAAARQHDAVLVVVAAATPGDPRRTARLALFDPRGGAWEQAAGPETIQAALARAAGLLAAPGARTPAAVGPLASVEVGGAARVIAPTDIGAAAGGGIQLAATGGLRIAQRVDVALLAGLDLAGPAATVAMVERVPATVTQRTHLVRIGVAAGPRLPLGRRAWLRVEAAGGIAFGGLAIRTGGQRQQQRDIGAWIAPALGVQWRAAPHVTVGPSLRYVHAWIPLATGDAIADDPTTARALRYVELALRVDLAPSPYPPRGDRVP
jgi:hypothetical protein